jgi:heme exporter protein A
VSGGASGRVTAVNASKLTKRYGSSRALGGVDLALRAGSVCALLGPNGAGKSTLLGILSTLVRPTSGEVSFAVAGDGVLAPGAALRRRIGVLAHDSFLYGGLTALENLAFYGRLYGVADAERRAASLLESIGLEGEARTRPVETYSRGMVQRLALARVLLHDPDVLFLDEPFTGLDRHGAHALAEALVAAKARGCVVLVVSHDLEPLARVTDHVVVLRRGKLVHEARREAGEGFSVDDLKDLYHRYTEQAG